MRQRHPGPARPVYGGRAAYYAAVALVVAGRAAGVFALRHAATASPAAAQRPAGTGAPRPASPAPAAGSPAAPPVRVCGNNAILAGGPAAPPKGAVVIPAGDDSGTDLGHGWSMSPDTTYWFAPGVHTLGAGQYSQIIPKNGDTFTGAPGAILDGRHQNLYAFTQQASTVTIRYLTIRNFGAPGDSGGQGVVNHDEGSGWHIDHVTVRDSAGAGVMLGSGNVLAWSCLEDNGEYGFQGAGSDITVTDDEVAGNNTDNWEARRSGCGCTGGAKFWGVGGAVITGNYVHDNLGPGLWADTNNRGFDVEHNYISGNQGEGFIYEISYNLRLAGNTFIRNGLVAGPRLGGFPEPAVYISESGADSRVPGPYQDTLAITGNTFTDNWSGVVLWENADRYCGSPANTSAGACTLVNPRAVTTGSCKGARLASEPYYSDCRWETKNVLVSRNSFAFDPARIGPDCTPARFCGFNGIFSQWGSWSPYHGTAVENHITFDQGNRFESNVYSGPWQFMVQEQGRAVSWKTWSGAPYNQDGGSTMNAGGKSK